MMVDSKTYRKGFEDCPLEELLEERERLLAYMRKYESADLPLEIFTPEPSSRTVYLMYGEYLKEIIDLTRIRMERDDFHSKITENVNCQHFDVIMGWIKGDAKEDMLRQLKEKDPEFYDEYMEWKENNGGE